MHSLSLRGKEKKTMINPYRGDSFFSFFITLVERLLGKHPCETLPSDEIQLFTLMGIALSSSFLGTFLTLKKMTMLANSLSHTILLGIVFVYLTTSSFALDLRLLLIAAFFTALLTAFLTEFFTQTLKLQEDASIGLIFTSLFALAVVLVTIFTKNAHISTEAIMGNIDALDYTDLKLTTYMTGFTVGIIFFLFRALTATSFDPAFSKAIGMRPAYINYLLMTLTAATAISAFRAVGVLLFLAFLVTPYLTIRIWVARIKNLVFLASLLGITISLIGVALSRHFLSVYDMPLSTSALVVTLLAGSFAFAVGIKKGLTSTKL